MEGFFIYLNTTNKYNSFDLERPAQREGQIYICRNHGLIVSQTFGLLDLPTLGLYYLYLVPTALFISSENLSTNIKPLRGWKVFVFRCSFFVLGFSKTMLNLFWTTGLPVFWTTGLLVFWTTGLLVFWTTGLTVF